MKKTVRSGNFQSVKKLLSQTLERDIELSYRQFNQILNQWSEIVGVFLADRMSPYCIERGILICYVHSSSLVQEISFLEAEILRKLKLYKFGLSIRAIRLTTHVNSKKNSSPSPPAVEKSACKESSQLTLSESQRLEQTVSFIQDLVIRERTLRFLTALEIRQKNLIAQQFKCCKICHSFYKSELKECFYCNLK